MPNEAGKTNASLRHCLAILGVLLLAVLLPRLACLGDFIYMDEGYHDYMARFINLSYERGQGFPQGIIGYKLFPILFHWVWNLPGNGTIWLRVADLLFALASGWMFCLLLTRESNSWPIGLLLALAFFTGMNLDQTIDSGFKNSFFPSFLCLFSALYISRGAENHSWRWLAAGALTATGILFRETFVLFPVIGFMALLFTRNYAALWRYVAGGIGAALLITVISAILRGQLWGIFEFYFVYGKIYGPEEAKRWLKFLENGSRAITFFLPLILLALWSIYCLIRQGRFTPTSRGVFWLACALAPLLEPMAKIGFLYHFSACLPGLAGLCACAYSGHDAVSARTLKYWRAAIGLAALTMQPLMYAQYAKLPITVETLKAWPQKGWPDSVVSQSNTLQVAKLIRELLPPGGTVSSTGFAYFVFPASLTEPPEMGLGDLSRTYIYAGYDKKKFLEKLDSNQPSLILLTSASWDHSATFDADLREIIENHPDYEFVAEVPPDLDKNYGWLGYRIYRNIRQK